MSIEDIANLVVVEAPKKRGNYKKESRVNEFKEQAWLKWILILPLATLGYFVVFFLICIVVAGLLVDVFNFDMIDDTIYIVTAISALAYILIGIIVTPKYKMVSGICLSVILLLLWFVLIQYNLFIFILNIKQSLMWNGIGIVAGWTIYLIKTRPNKEKRISN